MIARRPLEKEVRGDLFRATLYQILPLRRLRHAPHNTIQSLLSTFLQRLGYRFGALLICSEFQKAGNDVIQSHLAMYRRTMLQNYHEAHQLMRHGRKAHQLTVLDAVGSPLVLCHVSENMSTLIEEFIDDSILGGLFQVLESVLIVS